MKNNKNGKRKGAPQNYVKKSKTIVGDVEKITADEEKDTDKKENKMQNILEKIVSYSSRIVTMVGLFSTLCVFIRLVYNVIYKINCGNFYGIPEKYFITNIDKTIIYRVSAIVLVIIYFIPRIMEKYCLKHDGDDKANTMYSFFYL